MREKYVPRTTTHTHTALFAKALAHESGLNFISVKSSDVFSMYVGESEAAIRQLFATTRMHAPCVMFIDEIDAIVPSRDDRDSHKSITTQMLVELDSPTNAAVIVIAATNRPDRLDPALLQPTRLGARVHVTVPTPAERQAVMQVSLRGVPADEGLGEVAADPRLDGRTGAEVVAMSERARQLAVVAGDDRLTSSHVEAALGETLAAPRTATDGILFMMRQFGGRTAG